MCHRCRREAFAFERQRGVREIVISANTHETHFINELSRSAIVGALVRFPVTHGLLVSRLDVKRRVPSGNWNFDDGGPFIRERNLDGLVELFWLHLHSIGTKNAR